MRPTAAAVVAQLIAKTRDADHPGDLDVTLLAVTTSMVELGLDDMAGITERHGQAEFSPPPPLKMRCARPSEVREHAGNRNDPLES